ncbi:MAG TPA: IPT/TIG domain-containing protein [Bryobacteraceae bacterium]
MRRPGLTEWDLWDESRGAPLPYNGTIPVLIPISASDADADPANDRLLAVDETARGTKTIFLVKLSTGEVLETQPISPYQRSLAIVPDSIHVWLAQDETQGKIVRLNVLTGEIDQSIQLTDGAPPYSIAAQISPIDSRILVVSVASLGFDGAVAYLNGNRLPGIQVGILQLPQYGDGHFVIGQRVCEASASAGIGNCVVPAHSVGVVWKGMGADGTGFVDWTTGIVVGSAPISCCGNIFYFAPTERLYDFGRIADAGTLETLYPTNPLVRLASVRVRAPGWVIGPAGDGILATNMPQVYLKPTFASAQVLNSATLNGGPVNAGEIVTIFGSDIGPADAQGLVTESGLKLSTTVARTSVIFDGVPGALLYVGANQLNVVAPETVPTSGTVEVQVVRYGIGSPRVQVPAGPFSPGIFSYTTQGRSYAAAFTAEGALEGPDKPLARGTTVSFFATGLGLAGGSTGDLIEARPNRLPTTPTVTIGGVAAQVSYAGSAPGLTAGLNQVNVVIPSNASAGATVPVVFTTSDRSSVSSLVAIQ